MRLALSVGLGLAVVSGSAQAQSTLDKFLKKNTESSSSNKSNTDEAGINKVFKSPEGYWRLDDNRATGGSCAIMYVTPAYLAAYLGPSIDTKNALLFFDGPTIPAIKKETRKQVTITGADGKPQTTQAIHAPSALHKEMGSIVFPLLGIQEAMDQMSDVEDINIIMEKKQVFSIKWKGGHIARSAMQKCLASTPKAGAK
ncbi:MAG: hypothetical protein ABL918_02865 [Chakrabartia sp.]